MCLISCLLLSRVSSPVAPFCVQDQRTEYTVGLNEQTVITCEVQSDPSEATFKWFYNNSSETTELKNFLTSGSRSVLKYTPTSRYSYGTLFCVAQNSLGIQSKPCVFNVMPAGESIFFTLLFSSLLFTFFIFQSSLFLWAIRPSFCLSSAHTRHESKKAPVTCVPLSPVRCVQREWNSLVYWLFISLSLSPSLWPFVFHCGDTFHLTVDRVSTSGHAESHLFNCFSLPLCVCLFVSLACKGQCVWKCFSFFILTLPSRSPLCRVFDYNESHPREREDTVKMRGEKRAVGIKWDSLLSLMYRRVRRKHITRHTEERESASVCEKEGERESKSEALSEVSLKSLAPPIDGLREWLRQWLDEWMNEWLNEWTIDPIKWL